MHRGPWLTGGAPWGARLHRGVGGASMLDWRRIQNLQGRTLQTITGRATFDVQHVGDSYVVIMPQRTSIRRHIPLAHLEEAFSLRESGVNLVPSSLERNGLVTRNSSYIVALLQAIDGM